jgi:hypothetical protein
MTRAEHIAALVEALLADGVAPDAIGRAVAADVELGLRSVPRATADARKGTRLPEDWQPSERCIAYALDRGISRARISIEAEKFRNYWIAKSGRDATKRDWSATWRNWIITAMERGYGPPSHQGQRPGTNPTPRRAATGSDAIVAGMARLARGIDERRMSARTSGREVPRDSNVAGELDLGPSRAR